MKVSVIIPMYNAEKTILKCLKSVLEQTYKGNVEIIIVNDGSTDESLALVQQFIMENENINSILVNKKNGGVSSARNSGLKVATGEYIAFLDSDDAWLPEKIAIQVNCILNNEFNIDFVSTAVEWLYFKDKKNAELIKISLKDLIFKNYFQPSTVLMKRTVLDCTGYFDEDQNYAEEGNYFIRVAKNFDCYFLNQQLINYGDGKTAFGSSGLSANLIEMEKGELKNIKFAFENNYISFVTYAMATFYSLVKFCRRVLIVKFRG